MCQMELVCDGRGRWRMFCVSRCPASGRFPGREKPLNRTYTSDGKERSAIASSSKATIFYNFYQNGRRSVLADMESGTRRAIGLWFPVSLMTYPQRTASVLEAEDREANSALDHLV